MNLLSNKNVALSLAFGLLVACLIGYVRTNKIIFYQHNIFESFFAEGTDTKLPVNPDEYFDLINIPCNIEQQVQF